MRLVAKNIYKSYKDVKVLKNLNLMAQMGEFISIVGTSGSGKSTLLSILATLDRADSGDIFLNDINLNTLNNRELSKVRNSEFGFIFQSSNMIMHLNVKENITLPFLYSDNTPKDLDFRVSSLLQMLNLSNYENKKINQLSGGEQQRVAIARALINNPSIIFAYEPTGNLDLGNTKIILKTLKALSKEGKIVIVVTHDSTVKNYSDRVIELEKL